MLYLTCMTLKSIFLLIFCTTICLGYPSLASAKTASGVIILNGTAYDQTSGVDRVELKFSAENESAKICIDKTEPETWSCQWDTTEVNDGSYLVTATIYDRAGNFSILQQEIVVNNSAQEITPDHQKAAPLAPAPNPEPGSNAVPQEPSPINKPEPNASPQINNQTTPTEAIIENSTPTATVTLPDTNLNNDLQNVAPADTANQAERPIVDNCTLLSDNCVDALFKSLGASVERQGLITTITFSDQNSVQISKSIFTPTYNELNQFEFTSLNNQQVQQFALNDLGLFFSPLVSLQINTNTQLTLLVKDEPTYNTLRQLLVPQILDQQIVVQLVQ